MLNPIENPNDFTTLREVFMLFMLPIGGGIPAGVVLANTRGLTWVMMCLLYFMSDVVLACMFDPVMKLFIHFGKCSPFVAKLNAAFKKTIDVTTSQYGVKPRPHLLVLISFVVDPMTGRGISYMAGHGFISGWALAIAGDMIFFSVIMASTLWLNNILGDGTWTTIIITVGVIGIPALIKKIRTKKAYLPK